MSYKKGDTVKILLDPDIYVIRDIAGSIAAIELLGKDLVPTGEKIKWRLFDLVAVSVPEFIEELYL